MQISIEIILYIIGVIGIVLFSIYKFYFKKISRKQFDAEIYKAFLLAEKLNLLNAEKISWCAKYIAKHCPKQVKAYIKEDTIVFFLENAYSKFKSNLIKEENIK